MCLAMPIEAEVQLFTNADTQLWLSIMHPRKNKKKKKKKTHRGLGFGAEGVPPVWQTTSPDQSWLSSGILLQDYRAE